MPVLTAAGFRLKAYLFRVNGAMFHAGGARINIGESARLLCWISRQSCWKRCAALNYAEHMALSAGSVIAVRAWRLSSRKACEGDGCRKSMKEARWWLVIPSDREDQPTAHTDRRIDGGGMDLSSDVAAYRQNMGFATATTSRHPPLAAITGSASIVWHDRSVSLGGC